MARFDCNALEKNFDFTIFLLTSVCVYPPLSLQCIFTHTLKRCGFVSFKAYVCSLPRNAGAGGRALKEMKASEYVVAHVYWEEKKRGRSGGDRVVRVRVHCGPWNLGGVGVGQSCVHCGPWNTKKMGYKTRWEEPKPKQNRRFCVFLKILFTFHYDRHTHT